VATVWLAEALRICACSWINRSSRLLLELLSDVLESEVPDVLELLAAGVVMVTVEPSA